jgi:hypothetical protein
MSEMDKLSLVSLGELKAIVLGVSRGLENDANYKVDDAVNALDKAVCILHDMETECIQILRIGTLKAGV